MRNRISTSNYLESLLSRAGVVPNSGMDPTRWEAALKRIFDVLDTGISENFENVFQSEVEINQGLEKLRHLRRFAETNRPSLDIAYADNIDHIRPNTCCSGNSFYIAGRNFGTPRASETHPDDKVLLLPSNPTPWDPIQHSRIADVPIGKWKDSKIELPLPSWIGTGCVGFLDLNIYHQWETYVEELNQLFHDFFIWISRILGSNSDPIFYKSNSNNFHFELKPPMDTPPLTGNNYLTAGAPAIRRFLANESYNCIIEPGNVVTISWDVFNAINIKVEVLEPGGMSGFGIWVTLYLGDLLSGSCMYTPTTSSSFNSQVKLTATNSCGSKIAQCNIHIRKQPNVVIKGIEVIQTIQEFLFDQPERQNIVPLFQGKRTLVRVYLDPGLPLDFNHGMLNQVSGIIKINGSSNFPINPANIPAFNSENARTSISNSLNFLLHDNVVVGPELNLDVEVFSSDPYLNWGKLQQSCTLPLEIPKTIDIYCFLVRDKFGNTTSIDELGASMDRLRSIYPISWIDGINIKGVFPLDTDLDFNKDDSWFERNCFSTDLFDLLEEAANELDDNGEVFCAIVPENACSTIRGYGWPGGLDWIGGTSQRIAYWRGTLDRQNRAYIEGHEVGHALNFNENKGQIKIMGVDSIVPDQPYLIFPITDQIMTATSDFRWINPGEYLFLHYRDSDEAFEKCLELGLYCDIDVFYVEI